MIKSKLLDKKSLCHALIASSNLPEILIPVKGVIQDIHFHESFPFYDIKIIKFYDNINFLKEHLYDYTFLQKYKTKPRKLNIPKFNNVSDMETWFNEESNIIFCVESSFVVREKNEMVSLFEDIQEYIIVKKLRESRDAMTRPLYKGRFKMDSKVQFEKGINRMFGNILSDEDLARLNSWI